MRPALLLRFQGMSTPKKSSAKELKPGDKVEWNSSQGKIKGTVKKKLTAPMKIKTHEVAASRENPEFLVASDKTGAKAAHKPGELKKGKS